MRAYIDRGLFLSIIFLLGLGLVQVYSSSFIFAIEAYDDGLFFFRKQLIFVAAAIVVVLAVAYIPTKWLVRLGVALWCVAVVGVALTLVPGIGVRVGGALRWLNIGAGFRFEPSELLKYTTPFICAVIYASDHTRRAPFQNIILYLLPIAPVLLLIRQPDFGSLAIISATVLTLIFTLGLKWRYVLASMIPLAGAVYFLIISEKYRMARILAFMDPWADPAHKGFQVIQSMLGFHSGGVTGVGIGQGQGKLYFLPEAHTDFTMAVFGEEWGFVGMAIVLSVLAFVVFRGLQVSARANSTQLQVVSLGIIFTFALTVFINAGVAMGLLPTKGLGMPFLSYGGSALLVTAMAMGFLLNIERSSRTSRAKNFTGIRITTEKKK